MVRITLALQADFHKRLYRFILFLALISFTIPIAYAENAPRRRVFVLHSYNQGYQWTDEIQRGIEEVFALQEDIDIIVDYMDANEYHSADYNRLLTELYAYKYGRGSNSFELIIACDDHALEFLLTNRSRLFPNIPLVFCGVNDFKPERLLGQRDITGVNEAQEMRASLELGLRLVPRATRIVVVSGERLSEKINLASFKAIAHDYESLYEIVYLEGKTAEGVRQALQEYGSDSIVIYLSYMMDITGQVLNWRDGIALAASNPKLPIFVMSDFQVREGALGGMVVSGVSQGETAARLSLRILAGEDPDTMPPVMRSPTLYLFDDRMLEKFGIEYSSLPPSYELTNLRTGEFIEDWHSRGTRSFFAYELFERHGTNMLLIDPSNGTIVDANQAARMFYGYPRLIGMNISDINTLSQEEVRLKMAKAQELRVNYFNFRHELADGTIKDVLNYSWPVKVRNTDLLFSIIYDVTPQRQAEALAKKRDKQFNTVLLLALSVSLIGTVYLLRLLSKLKLAKTHVHDALMLKSAILDAIPNPVFLKDINGRYRECNQAFEKFTGLDSAKIMGRSVSDIFGKEDAKIHEEMDVKLFEKPNAIQVYEMSHRSLVNGDRQIIVHKAAILNAKQKIDGLVGIYTDMNELKKREEQLKDSLKNNQKLIKELHHRTKNNMQTVIALLNLKMSDKGDVNTRKILLDISQRIWTMALVHEELQRSGDLSKIDMQGFIDSLLQNTISAYSVGESFIQYRLDCPRLTILIDYALPVAMALNELISNSCKHAFAEHGGGSILVVVKKVYNDNIVIDYSDNGVGFDRHDVNCQNDHVTGLDIFRMLVEHQLNGSITFERVKGMRCIIHIPAGSYTERVNREDYVG